jgi:hypothetical protein
MHYLRHEVYPAKIEISWTISIPFIRLDFIQTLDTRLDESTILAKENKMITDTLKQLIDTINKMAPEVWNIYVRQALINGWTTLIFCLLIIIVPTPLFVWLKRTWSDGEERHIIVPMIGGSMILLGVAGILFYALPTLLNPQYAAIQNLLSIIKPVGN